MNHDLLTADVSEIKSAMYHTVTTASYGNNIYDDGLAAKTGLIRSESLIQRIHEVTKLSLHTELTRRGLTHHIHPPIGKKSPELNVWGFLKKKKQDIVTIIGDQEARPEHIREGPMAGQQDELGRDATSRSIVIGVRSQLSSVAKNFDTLMERNFAETINLRFRHPHLVMGEVYMLAVKDYNEQAMKQNEIEWKDDYNNIERFISIFSWMSGRENPDDVMEYYKYERCLLLLVDFSLDPPKIYESIDQLRRDGVVSPGFMQDFSQLSPEEFTRDLVDSYTRRHTSQ